MVETRSARSPEGREWTVSVARWQPPAWRPLDSPLDDAFTSPLAIVLLPVALAITFACAVVWPLLVLAFELPASLVRAAFSPRRLVVATDGAPTPTRMSWEADRAHAAAVAEQVARQLELGYERIQPHNAEFAGFG